MPQGFASGLAQGIFEHFNKEAERTRAEEDAQKRQTFQTLTSLLDEATPETRPVLLQQIGQVMGLKGKSKGFWDAISHPGATDLPDQLHQQISQIFGNLVGGKQAEAVRSQTAAQSAMEDEAFGLPSQSPAEIAQRAGLAGKVVMRDPQLERLEQLKTQYQYQKQSGLDKLYEQQRLMGEREQALEESRQSNRKDIETQKALLKAQGDVFKRATAKAGGGIPSQEDLKAAADEISQETGFRSELLQANIGLAKARTNLINTEAGQLSPDGTLIPMKPYQRAQFDAQNQAKGQQVFSQWSEARSKAIATGNKLQQIHDLLKTQAEKLGAQYDAARGVIVNDPSGLLNQQFGKLLEEARGLTAQKEQALQEMQGHWSTLKTQFGSLYNPGKDAWWIEPNPQMGGVAPAGAPRSTPEPATYDATQPQVRQSDRTNNENINSFQTVVATMANPASKFKVDQITKMGGQKVRVMQIIPPDEEHPYGQVMIKVIK